MPTGANKSIPSKTAGATCGIKRRSIPSCFTAVFMLMLIVRLETPCARAAEEFLDLVEGLSVRTAFQAPKIVNVGLAQVENRSLRILQHPVAQSIDRKSVV